MITDYDDDPLMAARNKLVAVHLAIHGLAETIAGNETRFYRSNAVVRRDAPDLNRGLKINGY